VPVFADARPGSFNTDAGQIARLITDRTRAIVVAHIAGEPIDMEPVMELAAQHDLYVVEDCAQAHGATCRGRKVGSFGHFGAFSTMSGKHHCSGGQGGIVYTRDESLHWQARRFADRGKPFNLEAPGNVVAGLNCNLDDLSAAIGCAQLAKLPGIIAARQRVGTAVAEGLSDSPSLSLGWQAPATESVYWFLRIRLDTNRLGVDKSGFLGALGAEGIPTVAEYRHIQCLAPWFRNRAVFGGSGFPWTCSDYAGPREPVFALDHALQAVEDHFLILIHENYGSREVDDILTALRKVEQAYPR
jgi:dTDP-4-amino-4,6-dideoxygalactose transaminase